MDNLFFCINMQNTNKRYILEKKISRIYHSRKHEFPTLQYLILYIKVRHKKQFSYIRTRILASIRTRTHQTKSALQLIFRVRNRIRNQLIICFLFHV